MKLGRIAAVLLVGLSLYGPAASAAEAGFPPNDAMVNGEFTKPIGVGWTSVFNDIVGSHLIRIDSGTARITKEMCGNATLTQEVEITSLKMSLAATARLYSEATKPDYYSSASILINYLDKDGRPLGATRFYNATGTVPWENSDTLHLVPVAADTGWRYFYVPLSRELVDSLKGVDPTKVKRLRVSLESFCSGKDARRGLYLMAEVSAKCVELRPWVMVKRCGRR
jgi:hypothetical protein